MSFKNIDRGSGKRRAMVALGLALAGVSAAPGCAMEDGPGDPPGGGGDARDVEGDDPTATPGAEGIGDPLFPTLGNGGYEVDHYDLALRYATAAPDQGLEGTATIVARATQALSSFHLDFAGESVGEVIVNGRLAATSWEGGELIITPARTLRLGELFVVVVRRFTARTKVADPRVLLGAPFFSTPDGSAWAAQPHNAHTLFPCNDHPSDKATFSFHLDVPAGVTAVANGQLIGQASGGSRSSFVYAQAEPMATELAQVVVGAFTVIDRGEQAGVHVRDVAPARLAAELAPKLAIELDHLAWMEERLGAFPFSTYGSLVADAQLGFALETQTLSLYAASLFTRTTYAGLMVHELAHQWFGNSVSPAKWSDVWQSEGHATWYEYSSRYGLDSPQFVAVMKSIYGNSGYYRSAYGPVAAPRSGDVYELFNSNVYAGGALTLYALRQEVGDATFQQIERSWVTRYRGRSASTQDFIALASELAGRDLSAFLHGWLYGETTPPMPGHPDWVVLPVTGSAAGTAGAAAVRLPAELASPAQLLRY